MFYLPTVVNTEYTEINTIHFEFLEYLVAITGQNYRIIGLKSTNKISQLSVKMPKITYQILGGVEDEVLLMKEQVVSSNIWRVVLLYNTRHLNVYRDYCLIHYKEKTHLPNSFRKARVKIIVCY